MLDRKRFFLRYRAAVLVLGLNLLLCALLVVAWFGPLRTHTFMGDDLTLMRGYQTKTYATDIWSDMIRVGADKFRPVTNPILGVLIRTFTNNFDAYITSNILLFCVNIFLFSVAVSLVAGRWRWGVLFASLMLLFSRFSYYSVLQVMGIMENMGMTFFVSLLLMVVLYLRDHRTRWLWGACALFALMVGTHERFVVIAAPLFLLVLLSRKTLPRRALWGVLLTIVLIPASFIGVKQFVLHSPFLTGTGGSSITSTFNPLQVVDFFLKGLANLAGLNSGPAYLVGMYFVDAGKRGLDVALLLGGSLVLIGLAYAWSLRKNFKARREELVFVLVMAAFIASLVFSASITFRLEQRWLYTPFAALILLAWFLLGKLTRPVVVLGLSAFLLAASLNVDLFYRQYVNNIFFINGNQVAESARHTIIDSYPRQALADGQTIIITRGYNPIQDWYFHDAYFFQYYTGLPSMDVRYVSTVDQIPALRDAEKPAYVFLVTGNEVRDVSADYRQIENIIPPGYAEIYNFSDHFADGSIEGPDNLDTPNGRGVFLINAEEASGPRKSLTILSGSAIQYPQIACKTGAELILVAGIPYHESDGANLQVIANLAADNQMLVDEFIAPADANNTIQWKEWTVPVEMCQKGSVSLQFRVQAKSGDDNSDWVILKYARFAEPVPTN